MYSCKYCGSLFNLSNLLASHTAKYHCTKKPEYTHCPHCNRILRKGHSSSSKHIRFCEKRHREYICESCGKLVKIPYGSGRFCSEKCSHHRVVSESTKEKLREAVKRNGFSGAILRNKRSTKDKGSKYYFLLQYVKHPKFCKVCGKRIPFNRHWRKTCGNNECLYHLRKLNGGYKKHSRRGNAGYYKGIYCDSTYELMFLIWCLDHNVPIERNSSHFTYEFDGVQHEYYPDFLVNGRMLVEIKNYKSELTDAKIRAVDNPIRVLYGHDLLTIADYVAKMYNKKYRLDGHRLYNNFKELYDRFPE